MITLEQYNCISFVVRGETENIKVDLKKIGGRWISNLKNGPGWLFNNRMHYDCVERFLESLEKAPCELDYDYQGDFHDNVVEEYKNYKIILFGIITITIAIILNS
jgi:hypothetical protein